MVEVESLLKVIATCEERLNLMSQYGDDENLELSVFPPNAKVLYYQLIGDSYLKLFNRKQSENCDPNDILLLQLGKKCLDALEEGMNIASESLQIVDRKFNRSPFFP